MRGYYRYLTHKDNPEKYQYDEKEIKTINGFNISDFVEMSKGEINALKMKIQGIIKENKFFEYSELMDFLLDNDLFNMWEVASSHTLFFDRYITSYKFKYKEDLKKSANNQLPIIDTPLTNKDSK